MRRLGLVIGGLLLAACAGCYTQGFQDSPPLVAALPVPPATADAAAAASPTGVPPGAETPIASSDPSPSSPVSPPGSRLHAVKPGENLYQIAQLYGVSVDAVIAANGISTPDRILVGQTLVIPGGQGIVPTVAMPSPQIVAVLPTQPLPTVAPPTTVGSQPTLPWMPPPPTTLNGILLDQIIVVPELTRQNVANIFMIGQALGRNPRAFSKLGDSIIENPHFLARFDGGPYNLGEYAYLQPVVEYYAGSFSRQGVAVRRGLHSWSVFDPMFATTGCAPGEHMVACEFRLNNPSVLFIRLGTNDVGVPESFDRNLRQLVEYCITSGVIPVLGTKADRFRDPADTNNSLIRQIAADYHVPLWDFDRIAQTLPNRGLDRDSVHLSTFFAHDYTQANALQRGHGVNNLTALMMLDAILRVTTQINR
ncbi:MAG: LysM peptidoglycan-binding domain-containing protein [Chloroflexi bacterium]|nr:LysM peptidoglycan-binding domain-containing protein [Chloroflexota bacterium]